LKKEKDLKTSFNEIKRNKTGTIKNKELIGMKILKKLISKELKKMPKTLSLTNLIILRDFLITNISMSTPKREKYRK